MVRIYPPFKKTLDTSLELAAGHEIEEEM